METYDIIAIEFQYAEQTRRLAFASAELVIVKDYGSALWYMDVSGIQDAALLKLFSDSEDIRIELKAAARSGEIFEGIGYFHPNEPHQGAAIRGLNELIKR